VKKIIQAERIVENAFVRKVNPCCQILHQLKRAGDGVFDRRKLYRIAIENATEQTMMAVTITESSSSRGCNYYYQKENAKQQRLAENFDDDDDDTLDDADDDVNNHFIQPDQLKRDVSFYSLPPVAEAARAAAAAAAAVKEAVAFAESTKENFSNSNNMFYSHNKLKSMDTLLQIFNDNASDNPDVVNAAGIALYDIFFS